MLAIKDPKQDNYVIRQDLLDVLIQKACFGPVIDICADPYGGNSLCPLYYSAAENALL